MISATYRLKDLKRGTIKVRKFRVLPEFKLTLFHSLLSNRFIVYGKHEIDTVLRVAAAIARCTQIRIDLKGFFSLFFGPIMTGFTLLILD